MTAREELIEKLCAWTLCKLCGHRWLEFTRVASFGVSGSAPKEASRMTWTQCDRCGKPQAKRPLKVL